MTNMHLATTYLVFCFFLIKSILKYTYIKKNLKSYTTTTTKIKNKNLTKKAGHK